MIEDEDRIWLDALAGRASAAGETAAAGEAGRLREQLLARARETGPPVPERDPAREEALIARARQEGLLAPAVPRFAWFASWRPALALTALVGVAVLAGWLMRPGREPETVRAGPDGIVRLQAPDPTLLARRIVGELGAAGIEATAYERLGRQGIDADLPHPLPLAVRSLLQRYGIPEPGDGVLRVEIEETTRP